MYYEYFMETFLTGATGEGLLPAYVPCGLGILAVMLLAGLYGLRYHTVRIYNWNGKRYCYLGRACLYRGKDGCRVRIGERIADLSYTTLYQICPSKSFVRKNRYSDLTLCAGEERCVVHVDRCMRQSIYYRRRL